MNIPRNQSQPFRIKPLATAIAACLALSTQLSYAATIVVDITTDGDISVNGNCTLRESIEAANTNSVIDGCFAGTGDDIINALNILFLMLLIRSIGENPNTFSCFFQFIYYSF